jgi:hypothetical protein
MTTIMEMNNSTMLVRKHKNEYFKADKLEMAFNKLIRKTKHDKAAFDSKKGKITYGSQELQKEAFITAPEQMKKANELKNHQEANAKDENYQQLKREKKLARIAKRKAK